mgnify:CR=1 FL=1
MPNIECFHDESVGVLSNATKTYSYPSETTTLYNALDVGKLRIRIPKMHGPIILKKKTKQDRRSLRETPKKGGEQCDGVVRNYWFLKDVKIRVFAKSLLRLKSPPIYTFFNDLSDPQRGTPEDHARTQVRLFGLTKKNILVSRTKTKCCGKMKDEGWKDEGMKDEGLDERSPDF